MILSNLERASDLIQSFKQVAVDQTSGDHRVFGMKGYLDEIVASLRSKYKNTPNIVSVNCSEALQLNTHPGAISQIISNLIMNSLIHAFDDRNFGEMNIDVTDKGDYVQLMYSDTGKGMPQEDVDRVFEPFFTTRKNQGGSGLGLHILYNLATQTLGGTVECTSTLGKGTTFTFDIPKTKENSND